MTYHVLARKWRPQTFSDLVGQNHVVKALTYALTHQQIHHAYLLTGTRGVGKTSIARIFAKSLNCETNGISANPCGQCESCLEIKSGKFVDLIEVDAASRTGVDETRELIESVAYLPSKGRYKVYLIDEVHMFSKSSFNALLKTLEEPPEHVKFILATTDPEKLPITILSRCLQFNLKSLTAVQIKQHLINICQSEAIHYDEQALELLANAGSGSMRDTLSMTDQAIAYGYGQLNLSAVSEILGTIQPNDIEAILFSIATNNPNQLNTALHRLDDYEVDARSFLIEIMKRLQRMAWAKEGIVDNLSPRLQSTVGDIPKALLHLWYDIAEKSLAKLASAGDARQAVEMALLRMLAFIPSDLLTRHRTLLDENIPDDAPLTVTTAAPVISQANPTKDTADAMGFAVQVQSSPITAYDSLDEAEKDFSQQEAPHLKTESNAPPNAVTPAAEHQSVPVHQPESLSQIEMEKHWHLSQEVDESETDINDVMAMMQTGRMLSKQQNNQPKEKANPENQIPTSTTLPPWQTIEDGGSGTAVNGGSGTAVSEGSNVEVKAAAIEAFDWYNSLKQLQLSDYSYHLASLGILQLQRQEDKLLATFNLDPKHKLLITEESEAEIANRLQHHFNQTVHLAINLTEIQQQTPAEKNKLLQSKKQADLISTFAHEAITQQVMSNFDAHLIEKTIKPVVNRAADDSSTH